LSRYVDDTQREEEKGLVEKKPGYTPSLIQRGLEQLGNVQRTARTPDPSTTGYTAHGDTTRPEEVTAEPRTSIFYPTITQDPQYTRPTERVKDTERPEETPHPQEEVPTPKITLPKPVKRPVKTVTSTTGRGDTERPEEAVKTEKRPSPPKSLADRAVTKIIGKVSPRKVEAIGKERYSHQTRDTTRLSELPPVEKRPHIDRSAEVWEAAEAPFVAVSTGLRSAGKGFRTQAALKSDLYSKTVYSGVGLGLRAGASAFEAFTMPVRPLLVHKSVENVAKVVTDAKYRGAAISQITKDPLGAGADIAGGLVGGYAFGRVASYGLQKAGVVKPSSYKLTQKTGSIDDVVMEVGKSPAELMPRGKWRSSWEIARRGGTSLVQLEKHPGLASYWKPVPVYTSFPTKLSTLIGGVSSLTRSFETVSTGEMERIINWSHQGDRTTPTPTPPSFKEGPIIITWSHRGVIPRKRYDPLYNPPPITIQKQKPISIQKQKPIQIQEQTQIISPRMVPLSTPKLKPPELTQRKTLYIDEPRKKTRKKGRKRKTRGEVRLRPVKLPKGWKF